MSQTKAQLLDGKSATIQFTGGSASAPAVSFTGDTNTGIYSPGADQVAISTNGTGRLFVDSGGRLLVNTSSSITAVTFPARVQSNGFYGYSSSLFSADALGSNFFFLKSRNATTGSHTVVQSSDILGQINFAGSDGTNFASGAVIQSTVDGAPASGSVPGNLIFATTATAGTSPSERLRITSAGLVGVGTSSPGAGLHIVSAGQTTSAVNTAGDLNTIISDTGIAAGNGGSLVFAAASGQWRFASIKGLVTNGSNNTQGDIVFSTRQNATDSALTERVRLDSQGRVGIGTTSPSTLLHAAGTVRVGANDTSEAVLQVGAGATGNRYAYIDFVSDTTYSTYGLRIIRGDAGANAAASILHRGTGSLEIITREAAPIVFLTNGTANERARIDSSGRLLVGTSSTSAVASIILQGNSSDSTAQAVIRLCRGTNTPADGVALGAIGFGDNGHASNFGSGATILAARDGGTWTQNVSQPSRLVFSTTADGASSPTERMRITNGGDINISTAGSLVAVSTGSTDGISFYGTTGTTTGVMQVSNNSAPVAYFRRRTTDGGVLSFYRDTTQVGTISVTTTATAYNTSSDYRLKENVTAVTDGITRLQRLKPSRFNFIADPAKTVDGFIAHEVQSVVPEAITGAKDAVDDDGNPIYQGIDQSKLVPLLTAALQEAIGEIDSLKARVAALESA